MMILNHFAELRTTLSLKTVFIVTQQTGQLLIAGKHSTKLYSKLQYVFFLALQDAYNVFKSDGTCAFCNTLKVTESRGTVMENKCFSFVKQHQNLPTSVVRVLVN